MAPPYTHRQGQYLAYIHTYTTLHGQPPSEAEMASYVNISPPSAHQDERDGIKGARSGHSMHACYNLQVWTVRLLDPADGEYQALPRQEKVAMAHALEKLEALGPHLPYPHSSDVRGVSGLRELRPRAGRSPWRAFYRRIGEEMVVGAIGPEAESNPAAFTRATRDAHRRLDDFETRAQR